MNPSQGLPLPDTCLPALKLYWEAARRQEFRLPRCLACKRFNWYPEPSCRGCGGGTFAWETLSGRGTLFSWAVVHRALDARLAPLQPYTVGIVQIAEDPAVRVVMRIVDTDPSTLGIGMPVRVRFEDLGYPVIQTGVIAPLCVAG
jgi:uncharacterized OB-fold protein